MPDSKMSIAKIVSNKYFIVFLFTLITLVITTQSFLKHSKTFDNSGLSYTHYNNYIIFKQSFFHLKDNKDLYQLFPAEHWDLYKYSPSFAVLMAPMALLPDSIGLLTWNLVNVLIMVFALWKFPSVTDRKRLMMLALVMIELITSTQNSQSNALIAGLLIFAFYFLEKNKLLPATLFIVLTVYIKLFGLVAFALFLLYPNKWKAALYSLLWSVALFLLPLLFVSGSQLTFLYKSWFNLLQNDHGISTGLSVAGWLSSWFGLEVKNLVVLIGVILFCLPFYKRQLFSELGFRILYLSSILIWVIIFNHRAESATFIIAIAGVAIWYFTQESNKLNTILLLLAILFSILSPTDLFPKYIRENYVVPYVLKAVPCIAIWIKISYDLMFYRKQIS